MSKDRVTGSGSTCTPGDDGAVGVDRPATSDVGGQTVTARRRLLGGALAAPAVLALHSGSALANTSANCVQKALKDPLYPSATSSADTWVRVQLYALKASASSSQVKWYISGSSLSAIGLGSPIVENNYLAPNTWLQFDPTATPPTTVPPVLTDQPVWAPGNPGVFGLGPLWVAVRFDASSMGVSIIGVVDGTASGTAVAGTCWASVVHMA